MDIESQVLGDSLAENWGKLGTLPIYSITPCGARTYVLTAA